MTGSIKMGEHDITGAAANYGLFFDSMGQVIVKAGDSNSVEVTDVGVTINSDVGITLNGLVSGITPASIGALSTAGGTINGQLTVNANPPSRMSFDGVNYVLSVEAGISLLSGSNTIDCNNAYLKNVRTPVEGTDAVNKQYIDGLVGNINSALDAINGEVI